MGEVHEIYRQLGGTQAKPRIKPGAWDFHFDGWVLELDEENHFNRYRKVTFEAAFYHRVGSPILAEYPRHCASRESMCSTHGGYWTNPSSEREFGPPGARGVLAGYGSPRWKQRAFYGYIKDLAPHRMTMSPVEEIHARLDMYLKKAWRHGSSSRSHREMNRLKPGDSCFVTLFDVVCRAA